MQEKIDYTSVPAHRNKNLKIVLKNKLQVSTEEGLIVAFPKFTECSFAYASSETGNYNRDKGEVGFYRIKDTDYIVFEDQVIDIPIK